MAIIVILAIIAVITVPIILNVIDNSKRGAAIDSAYGYKDAVYKSFLEQLSVDSTMEMPTGNFELVNDNTLNSETSILTVNVAGTIPDIGSWVELRKGEVIAFSLKIGDYIVTKYENEDVTAVKGTTVADNPELRDRKNAISKAKTLMENFDISGTSYGIIDFENGWVAVLDNKIISYSVTVEENSKNYIVTFEDKVVNGIDNDTCTAIIGEELSSKESAEGLIKNALKEIAKTKIDDYIATLLNNYTVKSYNEDKSFKVSEYGMPVSRISGMDKESWVYFKYNANMNPSVYISDYSFRITESNYDFVFNYISGDLIENSNIDLMTQKEVPTIGSIIEINREPFSVISKNNNDLVVVSKFCLKQYDGNYIQAISKEDEINCIETNFSEVNYWWDKENSDFVKNGDGEYIYDYRIINNAKSPYIYDDNCIIKNIIDNYVSNLNVSYVIHGRLPFDIEERKISRKDYFFWSSSVSRNNSNKDYIVILGKGSSYVGLYNKFYNVRPILELSLSDL